MNEEQLKQFVGKESLSIVEAMNRIDLNARGILFIVDENRTLKGCLTDGDIRRWIMRTGSINDPVALAMQTSPVYLPVTERSRAKELMKQRKITAVALVDANRVLLDVLFLSDCDGEAAKPKREDLSGVGVVVMAGGKGTRLYPYTKILPKPLIPIGDTPIVERVLDCFTPYGIDRFHMTVNYKKGMIKSYFADLQPSYQIEYVEEDKPLGTGGSIRLIGETFHKPLFVANCDSLILADYGDIYRYHVGSGNSVTMVAALKNMAIPYGVLYTGGNGQLLRMEEKPNFTYLINTGMYVISPETIDLIPNDTVFHMTQLVEKVMQLGGRVGTYPISEDSFLDMGEFSEMKRMEEKLNNISE